MYDDEWQDDHEEDAYNDACSWMKDIRKSHARMDQEFLRLCAEPCMTPVESGDRVVVATGFLSMGHLWVREEATVLKVGGGSVKVRFVNRTDYATGKLQEMWIHPALIVDVFKD